MTFIKCALIFAVLFSFSCKQEKSKKTSPEDNVEIIIDSYIRYQEEDMQLKCETSIEAGKYREHGLAAHLNGRMFLNGHEILKVPLKRKYYKYTLKTKTPTPDKYEIFIDLDNGVKTTIDFPYAQIDTFFLSRKEFSEDEGIIIHWKGDPLIERETILVMFTDADGNIKPWSLNGPTEKDKIFIPKDLIYTLANGQGTVYLTRRKKYKGIKGIVDYIFTTEFATPPQNYTVY